MSEITDGIDSDVWPDIDSHLARRLQGPNAYEYVRNVADTYLSDVDNGNVTTDPDNIERWADAGADADTTYYVDQYKLWWTLSASDNGDTSEDGATYTCALDAIGAESFLAARNVHVAVATVLAERITERITEREELAERLEYLRGEIHDGSISWAELAELQGYGADGAIPDGDTELRQWAGLPEFPADGGSV